MVVKGNVTMGCRELLNFGDETPVLVEWRSLNFGIIKDFITWKKKSHLKEIHTPVQEQKLYYLVISMTVKTNTWICEEPFKHDISFSCRGREFFMAI